MSSAFAAWATKAMGPTHLGQGVFTLGFRPVELLELGHVKPLQELDGVASHDWSGICVTLVCPCCSTSTCATLPAAVEASHDGPRLSALVGLLGSVFRLSFSKSQALPKQLLGVAVSRGEIATIRQRLSAVLARPLQEALAFARQQPVVDVDETGAPTGNADGNTPTGKRGWQWVLVTAVVTVFGPRTESIDGCRDRAAGEHLWRHCRERPLRQSVIQRKISLAVQSRPGAISRSRLLTVTTTLRQQGRDVWQLMEQAWIAHHRGGVVSSVLPDL